MEKRFWVYIVADKPYGTLYIGVTNDLARRMHEHKNGSYEGFTKECKLSLLVYHEEFPTALDAIRCEKRYKKWNREWKINNLIYAQNRKWHDQSQNLN